MPEVIAIDPRGRARSTRREIRKRRLFRRARLCPLPDECRCLFNQSASTPTPPRMTRAPAPTANKQESARERRASSDSRMGSSTAAGGELRWTSRSSCDAGQQLLFIPPRTASCLPHHRKPSPLVRRARTSPAVESLLRVSKSAPTRTPSPDYYVSFGSMEVARCTMPDAHSSVDGYTWGRLSPGRPSADCIVARHFRSAWRVPDEEGLSADKRSTERDGVSWGDNPARRSQSF